MQPEELLHYLPEFRVVICRTCQYAIQPSAIPRHLKEIHHILRSARRPFVEFTSRLDLADPVNVPFPSPNQFPVPGLPIEDGFACLSDGCEHLCVTIKRMKSHWNTVHPNQKQAGEEGWTPVALQTFFRGNQLRYFSNLSKDSLTISNGWKRPSSNTTFRQISLLEQLPTEISIQLKADEQSLFRHFLISTATTLSDSDELLDSVRSLTLTYAPNHRFIMDGILAVTALHIAYYDSTQREEKVALGSFYQARAIQDFRTMVDHVNEENCSAVFLFSHLVCTFAFTSAGRDPTLGNLQTMSSALGSLPDLFNFIRGVSILSSPMQHRLEAGPEKAIITPVQKVLEGDSREISQGVEDPIISLLWSAATAHGVDSLPTEHKQSYTDAIIELRRAYYCYRQNTDELNIWDAIYWWPSRIPLHFLDHLREEPQRQPLALICLAYYSVLLVRVELYWYMSGWGRRLLQEIFISLEEKDRGWIQPALDELMMEDLQSNSDTTHRSPSDSSSSLSPYSHTTSLSYQ